MKLRLPESRRLAAGALHLATFAIGVAGAWLLFDLQRAAILSLAVALYLVIEVLAFVLTRETPR